LENGSGGYVTYYHMGYDQMRQDNVVNPASKEYTSTLTGGSGKYFTLKGVRVKVGENGIPLKVVPEVKNSIDFAFKGLHNNGVQNQICASDTCNVSARLRPSAMAFKRLWPIERYCHLMVCSS
jgi:hypothetical protein